MAISERNRQIFEGAGFDAIKLEVAYGGIRFNLGSAAVAEQAREWLIETEAKMLAEKTASAALDRRRYRVILTWTAIAAVAGTVAAAAGIIQLFK